MITTATTTNQGPAYPFVPRVPQFLSSGVELYSCMGCFLFLKLEYPEDECKTFLGNLGNFTNLDGAICQNT